MVNGGMNLSVSSDTNRCNGDNLRRYSMGKASSLSIQDQSSSCERRSSIGSCHDFCKYGHKHSSETKVRVPLLKRAMKKSLDGQNLDQAVTVPEKEKQSIRGTKSKDSPSLGTCISGGTHVVKSVVPINSPTRQSQVETEAASESKEAIVLVSSPSRQSPIKIEVMSESKELIVPVDSPGRRSPVEIQVKSESKERLVPESSPSRRYRTEVGVSSECKDQVGESKDLVVPKSSPTRQSPYRRSPLKSDIMNESKELVTKTKTMPKIYKTTKQVVYSLTESESSQKQGLMNKIGEAGSDNLLKPKPLKAKSATSSGCSGSIAVHRNNSSKSGGAGTSKGIGTVVVGNSMATLDPNSVDASGNLPVIKNKNSKVVSRVISQNKTRRAQTKGAPNVETEEKNLSVINMDTKKTKLVESDQNEIHGLKGYPKSPSSLANGTSLSFHKEDSGGTKYSRNQANATPSGPKKQSSIKKEDDHIDHVIKKGRSPRIHQSKGKDSSSLNFNFRNKKAVDHHSESQSPMRLKIMRGKSLWDSQKIKDSHRTSLKKGVVKGISKNSPSTSEKVVLRHQDMEGKKDSQVLFNNVIAETARKLVRTRKSKVKALVGAFEKVISLQDKKPSVRATA